MSCQCFSSLYVRSPRCARPGEYVVFRRAESENRSDIVRKHKQKAAFRKLPDDPTVNRVRRCTDFSTCLCFEEMSFIFQVIDAPVSNARHRSVFVYSSAKRQLQELGNDQSRWFMVFRFANIIRNNNHVD